MEQEPLTVDFDDRHHARLLSVALRLLDLQRHELRPVVWACLYFFFLLAGYYVIRPIRDAMGLTGGVRDLKVLFFITLAVMMVANPIFSALVSRFPRRIFVPTVYIFFIANLLGFFALFSSAGLHNDINIARAFFIWVSVFNLFAVSVFWGMMADLFEPHQSQRLFGLISVGGTLGAIVGSASTVALARLVGETNLLPLSAVLLAVACFCVFRLNRLALQHPPGMRIASEPDGKRSVDRRIGGGWWSGITHLFASPYLAGIALFIMLHAFSGTLAYFLQGTIVEHSLQTRDARAEFFAGIDLNVNVLAVFIQVFLTGRIIKKLGVGLTLALLPLVVLVGFVGLGIWPTLGMLYGFQVVRRAANFALSRPARENLFTVVPREDKYKAKNLIDTVAYRGGDAAGVSWYALFTSRWIAMTATTVLWIALPLIGLWSLLSVYLGRRQRQLAAAPSGDRAGRAVE